METSHVIFLVVSVSVSFAIGRTIMHFRKKKKADAAIKAHQQAQRALRDAPPGPESKNKSKRRRQAREVR